MSNCVSSSLFLLHFLMASSAPHLSRNEDGLDVLGCTSSAASAHATVTAPRQGANLGTPVSEHGDEAGFPPITSVLPKKVQTAWSSGGATLLSSRRLPALRSRWCSLSASACWSEHSGLFATVAVASSTLSGHQLRLSAYAWTMSWMQSENFRCPMTGCQMADTQLLLISHLVQVSGV